MIPAKHRIQCCADVTIDCGLTLLFRNLACGALGERGEIVGHIQLGRSSTLLVRRARRRLNLLGGVAPLLASSAAGLRARTGHHHRKVARRQALATTMRHAGGGKMRGELGHGPAGGQHRLDVIERVGHPTLQQRVSGPSPQRFGKPCAVIPRRFAEGGAAPVRSPSFSLRSVGRLQAEGGRAARWSEVGSGGCHGRF